LYLVAEIGIVVVVVDDDVVVVVVVVVDTAAVDDNVDIVIRCLVVTVVEKAVTTCEYNFNINKNDANPNSLQQLILHFG